MTKGKKSDSNERKQFYPKIIFVFQDAPDLYENDKSTSVPLYATPERNQLIAEVQMPCAKNPEKWIVASVALLLQNQ